MFLFFLILAKRKLDYPLRPYRQRLRIVHPKSPRKDSSLNMKRPQNYISLLACAVCVSGVLMSCGTDTEEPPGSNDSVPIDDESSDTDSATNDTAGDEPTESSVENRAAALVGHYVERVTVSTLDTIPGLGERASSSYYVGLTDIEEINGKIISTSISCRSVVGSVSGVKVVISDELTQLIPPLVGEVTTEEIKGAIVFNRETVYMPLGVELEDLVNDELPTNAQDPRIIDQDEDGHPGVTIVLSMLGINGEIYAVRKEVGSWSVSEIEDGRFNGPFRDESLQKVIGANPSMLQVDMQSRPNPDESKSYLDLIRTEEKYDCERLLAELDTFFP